MKKFNILNIFYTIYINLTDSLANQQIILLTDKKKSDINGEIFRYINQHCDLCSSIEKSDPK